MATVFSSRVPAHAPVFVPQARRLARRMTAHVACAILVFALVQLWAVGWAMDAGGPAFLPYVALAVLLVVALPLARMVERRWSARGRDAVPSLELGRQFRRDTRRLWMTTLALPVAWPVLMLAVTG